MSILEVIAEQQLGADALIAHPRLLSCFGRVERRVRHHAGQADKERIADIVELLIAYRDETDADERKNILRTLEEITRNEPMELPRETIQDWDESLEKENPAYARAKRRAASTTNTFLKKYFTLRGRAGLATQAAVAKKSGLSRGYIAVIESGEHVPQQKTLQKLARAFTVDVGELMP